LHILLLPHPPLFTLFPYTTLFRSIFLKETNELVKIIVEAAEERKAENCVVLNMEQLTPITDRYVICHGNNERQVQAIARSIKNADRKSTRLNSSHVSISYAVFCLK